MKPLVKIGNTAVDIQDKISIVLRNPLFNENGTPGSYVFNFTVPLSDKVKKEISFSHLPGSTHKTYKKNVSIRAGSFYLEGSALITSLGFDALEISLPVFTGSLKNKLAELSLNELPLGKEENLIEYITLATMGQNFNRYIWFEEPKNFAFWDPFRFRDITYDPHNTYPDDPWQGWDYNAPADGKFIFTLKLDFTVWAGRSLRIYCTVNEGFMTFHVVNNPIHDEKMTRYFTFTRNLTQGDKVRFSISLHTTPRQNPSYSNLKHLVHMAMWGTSRLFVYSEFKLDSRVDRGYPHNNFTLLSVYNNNFFANASQSRFEIDEESLDFINKKFPVLNFYDNGFPLFLRYQVGDETYAAYNIISPQIFLAHIVKTIFEHTGINVENNLFLSDGDIDQLCIHTGACINNIHASLNSSFPTEFELADLLPDIPCSEFIADICKTLGIVFSYDDNTSTITFKRLHDIVTDQSAIEFSDGLISRPSISINPFDAYHILYDNLDDPIINDYFKDPSHVNFKGTVNTWNDLPWQHGVTQINDCYYVRSLKTYFYYTVSYQSDDFTLHGWLPYAFRFDFERITRLVNSRDDNTFEYKLPVSPITMRYWPLKDPSYGMERDILLPASRKPGIFKGSTNDDKSYQLIFWRNLQKDSNNDNYPQGSNAYQNLQGDIDLSSSLSEPFDLELSTGENSIFTKRFKEYLEWRVRNQGDFTFLKIMTSDQLADFDFFRWYRIMSMDYMIKELKFEISSKGLSPVQITALPRTSPPTFSELQNDWILATGHWNMNGLWLHEAKWNM